MAEERIQRATSTDGTEIAARIHGPGPPLEDPAAVAPEIEAFLTTVGASVWSEQTPTTTTTTEEEPT